MLNLQVIGNLGADAQVCEKNGRKYVQFRVAHSERINETEQTSWVSCFLNGDGGGLLPYLLKGQRVFVSGRMNVNLYSSPKTHRFEAGCSVMVDRIELCGARPKSEDVQQLAAADGGIFPVYKAFYVDSDALCGSTMFDASGKEWVVDANRFVYPKDAMTSQLSDEGSENHEGSSADSPNVELI